MSPMRMMLVAAVGALVFTTLGVAAQRTPTRVYDESTPGLVLPTVVSRENPGYTRAALDAGVAGHAAVDVTVDVDGSVRDVLLAKSVDAVHGLDEAALATAGRWVFKPGTLNGQAVPVRVRLAMSFSAK
jgi:TonB family protein